MPGSPRAAKPRRAEGRPSPVGLAGYSTREVSEVLGLPASTILSWARRGLLSPRRDPRGAYVFTFQDIAVLRSARDLLDAEVHPRRVGRTLESLRGQLPAGRPLSAVHLSALGGRVLVRDGGRTWEADTGQLQLGLESVGPAGPVPRPTPDGTDEPPAASPHAPADRWYDAAVDLEAGDPDRAVAAYARALELEPGHAEAHLNLGRLVHEAGRVAEAERHYRAALSSDPGCARASYNLGVALEDQGRPAAAVDAYEAALRLDPDLAAAHFNLSRLHEAAGRRAGALRHLAEYRRLLGRGGPAGI